jgi:FtsZ-binding cell division protein ZapB
MQTWDAWGGSWGYAWGYSWGFRAATGGGGRGSSKQKIRGWAKERADFEKSLALRHAQTVLRKTKSPEFVKLAQKINAYEVGNIDIDALRIENAQLEVRLQNATEYKAEMQLAQQAIKEYIQDEQEAIDTLLLTIDMDSEILLSSLAQ